MNENESTDQDDYNDMHIKPISLNCGIGLKIRLVHSPYTFSLNIRLKINTFLEAARMLLALKNT